jgi:hypothetical protein
VKRCYDFTRSRPKTRNNLDEGRQTPPQRTGFLPLRCWTGSGDPPTDCRASDQSSKASSSICFKSKVSRT